MGENYPRRPTLQPGTSTNEPAIDCGIGCWQKFFVVEYEIHSPIDPGDLSTLSACDFDQNKVVDINDLDLLSAGPRMDLRAITFRELCVSHRMVGTTPFLDVA
jgi:hypothetical protein